jgi:hypothetical protein
VVVVITVVVVEDAVVRLEALPEALFPRLVKASTVSNPNNKITMRTTAAY